MKTTIFVLFIILCFGKSDDLQLINATSQKWTSGIGISKGTKYFFSFQTNKSSDNLSINGVWINDKLLIPKVFGIKNKQRTTNFNKQDTIMLMCTEIIKLKNKDIEISEDVKEKTPMPYKYNGAALIAYKVGKKEKYLEIEKIKKLNPLNYPSKNQ